MTDFLDRHDKYTSKHCNELSKKDKIKTGYKNKNQLDVGLSLYKSPKYQIRELALVPETASKLKDRIFNPGVINPNYRLGIKVDAGTDQDIHERNILRPINNEREPERRPPPVLEVVESASQTGARNAFSNKKSAIQEYKTLYEKLSTEQQAETVIKPRDLRHTAYSKEVIGNLIDEMEDNQVDFIAEQLDNLNIAE